MGNISKRDQLFWTAVGIMQGEDVHAEYGPKFEAEGVAGKYETSYIVTKASLAEVTHFLLLAQQQLIEDGITEFKGVLDTECLIDAWIQPDNRVHDGTVIYY